MDCVKRRDTGTGLSQSHPTPENMKQEEKDRVQIKELIELIRYLIFKV